MIGTALLIKSGVVLGIISYVGGQSMGMSAGDVAAKVVGGGTAATVHMVKQTGVELKAAQAAEPAAGDADKKGN